ncbi:MAG: TolC family protein [Candidatus Cloacimonetes bacterium]|nr:TolC family protein [Candidatus Cloacimonadota bacterium]
MQKLRITLILMAFVSSIYSISLDELMKLTQSDNLLIQKEIIEKEQKSAEIESIKWLKNPMLSFGIMENMSSQQITQAIAFPTKTYWAKKAKEKALSKSQTKVDLIQQDVEMKLSLLYYNLAFIEKKIDLQSEKLAYLKTLEAVVEQKYIHGKTSQHHLIELKMKTLILQDKLNSLEHKDRYNLQLQINEIVDNKLDLSDIKTEKSPRKRISDFTDLYAESLKNYPLLILKQQNIEQGEILLQKEKQSFWPDLSLGITRENNKMLKETSYSFMFGFSLPLQIKANKAAINSKRNSLEQAKLERTISENQVKLMLQKLQREYEDLEDKLDLFENQVIPLAKQIRKLAATSYQNETIDFKTYITTINDLIDKKLEYYKFEKQFNQKIVEITNLTQSEEK